MQVIIASKNPVKIKATKLGFGKVFPKQKFSYQSFSIPSGVNDQPMTDQETLEGAINRVNSASKKSPQAHFWVGIEGGIEHHGREMAGFAWVVVKHKSNKLSKSRTASFTVTVNAAKLIRSGVEMGPAYDQIFSRKNIKHQEGAVGIHTRGLITRADLYIHALILALSSQTK